MERYEYAVTTLLGEFEIDCKSKKVQEMDIGNFMRLLHRYEKTGALTLSGIYPEAEKIIRMNAFMSSHGAVVDEIRTKYGFSYIMKKLK